MAKRKEFTDMKNGKIGYAVLGLGIGMAHAEGAHLCEDCELVAACDLDTLRLEKFSELYPYADTYTDFDRLLKDERVDIISICLPSSMHAEFAVSAMEAGKNVLIEKPIDITPERAMLIEQARLRTGKLAGVVHQNRFNLDMYRIKSAVESGGLGKLYLGTFAVKWYREQSYYDRGGWRGTWKYDGGGSLMNQSIHTIDLMQWLMGEVRSVRSVAGTVAHNIETEDMTASLVEFESGAVATFVSTTCAYPGLSTEIMLYGTGGSIEADGDRLKRWNVRLPEDRDFIEIGGEELSEEDYSDYMLEIYGKGNRTAAKLLSEAGLCADGVTKASEGEKRPITYGHRFVVEDMVRAVKDGKDPAVMPLEAMKSLKIVRDIYDAAGILPRD